MTDDGSMVVVVDRIGRSLVIIEDDGLIWFAIGRRIVGERCCSVYDGF